MKRAGHCWPRGNPLYRISFEAAYAKLTIAYNQGEHSSKSLMEQCIALNGFQRERFKMRDV